MSTTLFSLAKSNLGEIFVSLGFATPLRNLLPVKKIYEDDFVFAFWHPKPFWEKHIIIVPKQKIANLDQANGKDFEIMGHICKIANKLVNELELVKFGYRLLTNGGKYQKVHYLHFHIGAGKQIQTDEDGFKNSLPEN